jgi:Patatin-like phospholipase
MNDRKYNDESFANPRAVCDIIMKGGVTSGVVFPLAIAELARNYRFASIGGTSAGAIAAAAAAAAEYGRQRRIRGKGFMRLIEVPSEVGEKLFSLFQPVPELKALFRILTAALRAKTSTRKAISVTLAAIGGYWRAAAIGALPGVLVALIAAQQTAIGFLAFGLLLAVVGLRPTPRGRWPDHRRVYRLEARLAAIAKEQFRSLPGHSSAGLRWTGLYRLACGPHRRRSRARSDKGSSADLQGSGAARRFARPPEDSTFDDDDESHASPSLHVAFPGKGEASLCVQARGFREDISPTHRRFSY